MPAVPGVGGQALPLVGSGRCFCGGHLFYLGLTSVFSAGGVGEP